LVQQLLYQSNEAEDATVNIDSPMSQINDRIAQYQITQDEIKGAAKKLNFDEVRPI
jgi:hypothetical protein